jgi:hypothetical protein
VKAGHFISTKGGTTWAENTPILQEIIRVLEPQLDDRDYALDQLESHFHDVLLANAGNVSSVSTYAEELRLRVTPEDSRWCSTTSQSKNW